MGGPISLPPVRLRGAYFSLTYTKGIDPSIIVNRNGIFDFELTGTQARHFISRLEQTNGYDTLVEILDEHDTK